MGPKLVSLIMCPVRREEVLERLRLHREALSKKYGIERLRVFGSVARGEAGPDSDVDVLVKLAKPDLFVLSGLRDDLSAILGCSVDLVQEHSRLRPLFAERVAREAIDV